MLDLFFLNSANLICRDTDISYYFRESLELRDNESQQYFWAENAFSGAMMVDHEVALLT